MNTPTTQPQHPVVAHLDEIYASLVLQAEHLRDAFFQTALSLHEGKPGHVPIVIRIKKTSPNAVSIIWSKMIFPKIKEGEPKKARVIREINKGVGNKYPAATFSHIKEPLKSIARAYENQLADIREACSVNQRVRRQLIPHTNKAALIESTITAFVTNDFPEMK